MTHEELLNRIAQAGLEPYGNVMPTHLVLALRAVVELHKPQNKHEVEFGLAKCDGCYMPYPCSTIQAIEKELN
ncbi:hypothetical protein EBT25_13595 [bacterium]|nr:hypothetical protein [bacterium]